MSEQYVKPLGIVVFNETQFICMCPQIIIISMYSHALLLFRCLCIIQADYIFLYACSTLSMCSPRTVVQWAIREVFNKAQTFVYVFRTRPVLSYVYTAQLYYIHLYYMPTAIDGVYTIYIQVYTPIYYYVRST